MAAASVAGSVVDLEVVASGVGEASVVVIVAAIVVGSVVDAEVLAIKVEVALVEEEVGLEVVPPTATELHPRMHLPDLAAVAALVVGMAAPLTVA